tara:strand:- start:357 stop:1049 length:693 start_codon:yes stop_codon:yes gene_type:complete
MKLETLKEIIKKKEDKSEFAIITNLETGNSEIIESDIDISKDFEKYRDKINDFYKNKKSGVIDNTSIFIETYLKPIKVIIVGAVNIAQYLIDYIKNLNFEIIVIDPRGYFITKQRFSGIVIINKWPNEAFKKINTNSSTALITLTHDPKIDDPALQHALKKKFYYIGALGSKKTHTNRCERLKLTGFNEDEIKLIHGPIGIDLGGKSASEIALSIAAQLVAETHKKSLYI